MRARNLTYSALVLTLLGVTSPALISPANAAAMAISCPGTSGIVGRVVAANGTPTAGTPVSVFAEPEVDALTVGQQAPLALLGQSTTTSDGCYSIGTQNAQDWIDAADADGDLTVKIVVQHATRLEMRNVSLIVQSSYARTTADATVPITLTETDSKSVAGDASTGIASASGTVTQFFSESKTGASVQSTSTSGTTTTQSKVVSQLVPTSPGVLPAGVDAMKWEKVEGYGALPVLVGQFFSTTPNTDQTWLFGRGSTTSLGSAFSISGAAGSFESGQGNTRSTDSSVTFPTAVGQGGWFYRSFFRYAKFDLYYHDYISGWFKAGTEIRRTSWERGTEVIANIPAPTTHGACSPYDKGSVDRTAVSAARTWSDGVLLTAPIISALATGVTLSSQTGFSREARNQVTFTRGPGRLCGVDGPLSQPGMMIAKRLSS